MMFSGCSGSSHANAVDSPLARESLKVALDHWKKGEDPKALQSSATPMVAKDFEWDSGAKLVDYELLDNGKEEDANLRVQVKITLSTQGEGKNKAGREEGLVRGEHQSVGHGLSRHHAALSRVSLVE